VGNDVLKEGSGSFRMRSKVPRLFVHKGNSLKSGRCKQRKRSKQTRGQWFHLVYCHSFLAKRATIKAFSL